LPGVPLFTIRRALMWFAVTALCIAAVGCGDDGPSDSEQIASAVKRAFMSTSAADQCEAVSDRFAREVSGGRARCLRSYDAQDVRPDITKVAATRIDGDRATTDLTLSAGDVEPLTGRVSLVKVGMSWKLDRLGLDFLRLVMSNGAQVSAKAAKTARDRRVVRCFLDAVRGLSGRELRRVGNAIVGKRHVRLPRELQACRPVAHRARSQR
jgi:hypothetical protein